MSLAGLPFILHVLKIILKLFPIYCLSVSQTQEQGGNTQIRSMTSLFFDTIDDIEPAIEDIHGFTPRHYAQIEKNVGVLKLLDQYESKLTSENSSSRK